MTKNIIGKRENKTVRDVKFEVNHGPCYAQP
jgi:hypothetical protein